MYDPHPWFILMAIDDTFNRGEGNDTLTAKSSRQLIPTTCDPIPRD
jgi:hypothetical protein